MRTLKSHGLLGFAAGFYFAITALQFAPQHKTLGAIMLLGIWLGIILAWEWLQQIYSGKTLSETWKHSLLDISVGLIAFLVPFIVITFGTYAGNVLRP